MDKVGLSASRLARHTTSVDMRYSTIISHHSLSFEEYKTNWYATPQQPVATVLYEQFKWSIPSAIQLTVNTLIWVSNWMQTAFPNRSMNKVRLFLYCSANTLWQMSAGVAAWAEWVIPVSVSSSHFLTRALSKLQKHNFHFCLVGFVAHRQRSNITVPVKIVTQKHNRLSSSQQNFEHHLFVRLQPSVTSDASQTMKGLQAYDYLFSDASQQAKSQPNTFHKFVCRSINAEMKCLKCMHEFWFWIKICSTGTTKLILKEKKKKQHALSYFHLLPDIQGNSQEALPNSTSVQLEETTANRRHLATKQCLKSQNSLS